MSATVFVTTVDISTNSGSGIATREIVRSLGRVSDGPLIVLCPEPENDVPDRLKDHVDQFEFLPKVTDPGSPRWRLHVELITLWKLGSLFRETNISTVVTRLSQSTLFPAPLCNIFGAHHSLLVRGWVRRQDEYGSTRFGRLVEQITRMNVRLSDSVFVAFDELRQWIEPYRSDSQTPIKVLPNAVDPNLFSPAPLAEARNSVGIEPEAFVVGFVGSLALRHEVSTLLDAAATVDDVRVVIVGDGEIRSELEKQVASLGIRDRVRFVGRVPHNQVPNYVAAFDACYGVVSTTKSSNPIKCYEYLASERPVITSASPEMQFIENNDLGIVVDELSADAVADAIQTLQNMTSTQRAEIGSRGRAYIIKNHTWDAVARQILSTTPQ